MVKNFWGALTVFAAALFLPQPAFAAGLNGAELSIGWVLPFAGILLCIAICPLAVPHFWHGNYGKVAVFWALATAVPLFVIYGGGVAAGSVAHALIGDYIPFIIFVGSLYTVAGGIRPRDQAATGRGADTAGIGLGEHDSLTGEAFHVGRLVDFVIMRLFCPERQGSVFPSHIVNHKEDDVRPLGRLVGCLHISCLESGQDY